MKQVGSVIAAPLKALGIIKTPKKSQQPAPMRSVTRDDVRDRDNLIDEIRRRRGGAADILTGPGGAEAGSTGKTTLG